MLHLGTGSIWEASQCKQKYLNHRYKKVAKSGCRYNQKVKDIRGWQVDL